MDGLESKTQNKNKIPREFDESCGCNYQKSANGAVAVGLPHRNRSVFKHTRINEQEEKELIEDD